MPRTVHAMLGLGVAVAVVLTPAAALAGPPKPAVQKPAVQKPAAGPKPAVQKPAAGPKPATLAGPPKPADQPTAIDFFWINRAIG